MLARNREKFSGLGVKVLAPSEETAHICFDKFLMFQYLKSKNISTVSTWENLESFESALSNKEIKFPVFVKPRTGSGSVGAKKVINNEQLVEIIKNNSDYIIQEFMSGSDIDVDVYVDNVTHEVVSAFSKIKIETRIGGASKTDSFKDYKLFDLITEIV